MPRAYEPFTLERTLMTVSIISNICIILMVLMYKYRVWEWSDLPFFEVRSNFYREKIR